MLQNALHGEFRDLVPSGFTVEDMAALLDHHRAQRDGLRNTHRLEQDLRDWLATPDGERFHTAWQARQVPDVHPPDHEAPAPSVYESLSIADKQRFYQESGLWTLDQVILARRLGQANLWGRQVYLDLVLAVENGRHDPRFAGIGLRDAARILDELATRDTGEPDDHYYERWLAQWQTLDEEGRALHAAVQALLEQAPHPPRRWLPDELADLFGPVEELRERPVSRLFRLREGATEVYRARFEDGVQGAYKPGSVDPENFPQTDVLPADQVANREVAGYAVDRLFDFGLVPPAVWWEGHRGWGSMSLWMADATQGRPVGDYSRAARHQMAVFDYVIGNLDRNDGNWLTRNGRPVAIDHAFILPETDLTTMKSPFLREFFSDQPVQLHSDVLAKVRAVRAEDLAATLRALGLNQPAIDGAVARLREIQQHGIITGDAWRGLIVDHENVTIRAGRQ
jgi:hypothetical protein